LRSIEAKSARLVEWVSCMQPALSTARPRPGKWSIHEIIEHLVLSESADSARSALAFVSFSFRGRRFDELPADFSQRLGASGADTVGSGAGTVTVLYGADSGTARLRPWGGGYARIDFDVWYSPTYVPVSPKFRVAGYTEVPYLAACDLP